MKKLMKGLEYLSAVSIGSLITSICFYWGYGLHMPMVVSAGCVACFQIIKYWGAFMDETLYG